MSAAIVFIAAYLAVTLACIYAEARLFGEAEVHALWLIWPIMLPMLAVMAAFDFAEHLGARHRK